MIPWVCGSTFEASMPIWPVSDLWSGMYNPNPMQREPNRFFYLRDFRSHHNELVQA